MLWFAVVVKAGSFTRAALALRVSKQALSASIAKLELQLGVRLLHRTTRSLRPTEVGAAYYERCQALGAAVEEANRLAADQHAEPRGRLRVSAPMLLGRKLLGPKVVEYTQKYPEVEVELLLADRRVELIEEGFDIAIRVGRLADSSLTARLLGHVGLGVVASPTLLARGRVREVADLRSRPTIGMNREETWRIGDETVSVRPNLVVNDMELLCAAAVAGVGFAHLPTLAAQTAIQRGELRALWPGKVAPLPVHALTPGGRFLAAKVRRFMDVLSTLPLLRP
jgi:DNA-binding transcriptional LysR family regulator